MRSVILLPGLACDEEVFRDQAEALRSRGPVHVSDAHTRCATLPAMAAALWAERPGPQVLVGTSMGGMVALEMARQAPQRVRGIALLGSTARPDTPELVALRTQACALYAAGRMDEVLRANILFAFHRGTPGNAPVVAAYLAMIRRAGAGQLIAQNRAVMARIDSRPHLPAIAAPVLLACGEDDRLTPPEVSRDMAALLPQARLAIVEGAGHMLTMEQPAAVNRLLLDWLGGLGD